MAGENGLLYEEPESIPLDSTSRLPSQLTRCNGKTIFFSLFSHVDKKNVWVQSTNHLFNIVRLFK